MDKPNLTSIPIPKNTLQIVVCSVSPLGPSKERCHEHVVRIQSASVTVCMNGVHVVFVHTALVLEYINRARSKLLALLAKRDYCSVTQIPKIIMREV